MSALFTGWQPLRRGRLEAANGLHTSEAAAGTEKLGSGWYFLWYFYSSSFLWPSEGVVLLLLRFSQNFLSILFTFKKTNEQNVEIPGVDSVTTTLKNHRLDSWGNKFYSFVQCCIRKHEEGYPIGYVSPGPLCLSYVLQLDATTVKAMAGNRGSKCSV